MKTLFYSLLALLSICFTSSTTNANTLPLSPLHTNEVQEITDGDGGLFKFNFRYVRGRKNEAGVCVGRGLCELDISFGALEVNSGGLQGELRKDRSGNVLFIVDKGGMTKEDSIDFTGFETGPGILYLSNNSEIPVEGKTELGLPSKYQLKAGNYQVTETATTYIVNFGK